MVEVPSLWSNAWLWTGADNYRDILNSDLVEVVDWFRLREPIVEDIVHDPLTRTRTITLAVTFEALSDYFEV